MDDQTTRAQNAFALRLAADLLTGLVVTGLWPKRLGTLMIEDALENLLQQAPDLAPELQEIAATLTAQMELAAMDVDRRKARRD